MGKKDEIEEVSDGATLQSQMSLMKEVIRGTPSGGDSKKKRLGRRSSICITASRETCTTVVLIYRSAVRELGLRWVAHLLEKEWVILNLGRCLQRPLSQRCELK